LLFYSRSTKVKSRSLRAWVDIVAAANAALGLVSFRGACGPRSAGEGRSCRATAGQRSDHHVAGRKPFHQLAKLRPVGRGIPDVPCAPPGGACARNHLRALASNARAASRSSSVSFGGRPPVRPARRAASRPRLGTFPDQAALEFSQRAKYGKTSRPCAVVVSRASVRLRKPMPLIRRVSTVSISCFTD
jgi:hypothetical protein